MEKCSLVTGANGHLGNCLVKKLVEKGQKVRAGVRDIKNTSPFKGVNCEIVHTDLIEMESLRQALHGVETLYQVAAVYKLWAKNTKKEIIQPNLAGTRNIIEAAAECNVKKIIYVSSIAALDKRQTHMNEKYWNQDLENPYYRSKTESEKLALDLAKFHDLFLVSVLPSAMIGSCHNGRLTPTMRILANILNGRQILDPCFNINFVSVDDVAEGIISSEKKGRNRERYILGSDLPVSTSMLFKIAKEISPKLKIPSKPPKSVLMALAVLMEMAGKIGGKEPNITRSIVTTYYKDRNTLDLSKSRTELDFNPKDPLVAIRSTMEYLHKYNTFRTG